MSPQRSGFGWGLLARVFSAVFMMILVNFLSHREG